MPQKNIKKTPITVYDKNDPRLKAYQDSLKSYNQSTKFLNDYIQSGGHILTDDQIAYAKRNFQPDLLPTSNPEQNKVVWTDGRGFGSSTNRIGEIFLKNKPIQPYTYNRPQQTSPQLNPANLNSRSVNMSFNDQPYSLQQMSSVRKNYGDPVYAIGGENSPLLGYYNKGIFEASDENPNATQYTSNPEYMKNLIKRNYGTDYKTEEYKMGGKIKGMKNGKKCEYGLGSGQKTFDPYDFEGMRKLRDAYLANQSLTPIQQNPEYESQTPIQFNGDSNAWNVQNNNSQQTMNDVYAPAQNADVIRYDQPISTPKTNPRKGSGYNGEAAFNVGEFLNIGLGAINAFYPEQVKDKERVIPRAYNPYKYGTGSQAIMEDGGVVAESGIHIDPKNKGKFNALKKRTGKSTEELTHSKNPLTRKRAIFAQNAAKWHKGEDGLSIPDDENQESVPDNENQEINHLWGGSSKEISSSDNSNPIIEFSGKTHDQGGIGIEYAGKKVEVEDDETGWIDHQGALNIFGKMDVPGTNKKFKTVSKDLARAEEAVDKKKYKSLDIINNTDPNNSYTGSAFNSAKVMFQSADKQSIQISSKKQQLADLQNAMLMEIDKHQKMEDGGVVDKNNRKIYNPNLASDKDFQNWYNLNTPEGKANIPYNPNSDYDYLSYYKNGDYKNYSGGHFPDTYKTPNHKTFSNESIYSTPENPGGSWQGENYNSLGMFKYKNGGRIPLAKDGKSISGSNTNLESLYKNIANALAMYESGNNPGKTGSTKVTKGQYAGENALGKYQIMPGNLPQWSKEAFGREVSKEEFLRTPELQDQVALTQIKKLYSKYGNEKDVFSSWLTGKPLGSSNAKDDNGVGANQYVNEVSKYYKSPQAESMNKFPSQETPSNIDPSIKSEYERAKASRNPKDVLAFQQKFHQLYPNVAKKIINDNGNITTYGRQEGLSTNDIKSNEDGLWGPRTDQYMAYVNQHQSTLNTPTIPESNTNSESQRMVGKNSYSDGSTQYSSNTQKIDGSNLNFNPTKKLPSNAKGLDIGNIAGELYSLATNRQEPAPHFSFDPTLYTPYNVSFQDKLNENNATFKSIEQQLPNNASALSVLAAQKYSADNGVLSEQFRTNQGIDNDITNKNVGLLNQSAQINLQLDQQQAAQTAQAKFNTRREFASAIGSLSKKYEQNQLENKTLQAYENLYNYRFDKSGNAADYNPNATFNAGSDRAYLNNQSREADKVFTKTDARGNVSTTEVNNSDLADIVQARKALKDGATMQDIIQAMPHLSKYNLNQ